MRTGAAAARQSPSRRAPVSRPALPLRPAAQAPPSSLTPHPSPCSAPSGPAEMDEEDYERRRSECVHEMLDLEKQFSELKEK